MTARSRRLDLLILMAAVVLGLLAESVAFEWDDARHWVPDLIVGLLFAGGGLHAWRRNRGVGMLLVATGVAWFLGSVADDLLYLHRGPLVHLLLVFPMLRPRCSLDVAAVTIGYGAAVAPPVWRSWDPLAHLSDRVGALGGRLALEGETLRAELPCA